jgi:hypothetical protein
MDGVQHTTECQQNSRNEEDAGFFYRAIAEDMTNFDE